MVDHVSRPTSDQKNDGWRLVERLKAIGHVDRPSEHVLALGTLDAFYDDCQSSTDGQNVLKSRANLTKLVGGYYKGGKPWKKWETRQLSTAIKLQLLMQLNGVQQQPLPTAEQVDLPSMELPDYGLVATEVEEPAEAEGQCANGSISRAETRLEAGSGKGRSSPDHNSGLGGSQQAVGGGRSTDEDISRLPGIEQASGS
eukprot:CAMPEP_0115882654 /NCGR_PEP_ID=MMETSP0287-20121206/29119_1 /TAXON_ID=412157 /ORGANISM="Chrysochromulina rotalis, Strain UIO044" /LENGTH=198 /DNA_ID=CAMNT_0003338745 /DNA_START=94 /DNA_END=687 /DNA_ORIENTATION=-